MEHLDPSPPPLDRGSGGRRLVFPPSVLCAPAMQMDPHSPTLYSSFSLSFSEVKTVSWTEIRLRGKESFVPPMMTVGFLSYFVTKKLRCSRNAKDFLIRFNPLRFKFKTKWSRASFLPFLGGFQYEKMFGFLRIIPIFLNLCIV